MSPLRRRMIEDMTVRNLSPPTVTAGAYASALCIGGKITFAKILPASSLGILYKSLPASIQTRADLGSGSPRDDTTILH
jgi:hypothetical protein